IAAYEIPSERLRLPQARKGTVHVFHQYTIRLPRNRDAVQRYLAEHGVGCAIHYPTPIHRQPIMVERGLGDADVPVAERAAAEVLSLPVHPSLTADDVAYIAATLAEAIDAAG